MQGKCPATVASLRSLIQSVEIENLPSSSRALKVDGAKVWLCSETVQAHPTAPPSLLALHHLQTSFRLGVPSLLPFSLPLLKLSLHHPLYSPIDCSVVGGQPSTHTHTSFLLTPAAAAHCGGVGSLRPGFLLLNPGPLQPRHSLRAKKAQEADLGSLEPKLHN